MRFFWGAKIINFHFLVALLIGAQIVLPSTAHEAMVLIYFPGEVAIQMSSSPSHLRNTEKSIIKYKY